MKTFFLFTLSILWLVFSVFAADATPKTVTASSSNGSLLWPTNFFSANSNAILTVLGGRETGVLAIDRGGTGTTNAAGVRGVLGLDVGDPGSMGTNWLTLTTAAEGRGVLGLDVAAPGALGTNLLTQATAGGVRGLIGLDAGAPGALGTNLLTQATSGGVRGLVGLDAAAPGSYGTNWLTLSTVGSARTALGLGEWTTNSVPAYTGNHSSEAALDVDDVLGDAGVRFKYGTNEYMLMLYGTNLNLVSALDGIPSYVASPGEAALLTYKSLTNLFVLKTNDYGVLPLLASDPVEIATNTYSRIYTKVGQKSRATLFGQVLEPVGVTNLASEVVMVGPDAVATVDTIILGSTNIIEGIAGKQPYDAQLDQWATVGTNSVTALGVGALTATTVHVGATNVVAAISGKQDADAQLDEWAGQGTNSVSLGAVVIGTTNVVGSIAGKQDTNVVATYADLEAFTGPATVIAVANTSYGGLFTYTTNNPIVSEIANMSGGSGYTMTPTVFEVVAGGTGYTNGPATITIDSTAVDVSIVTAAGVITSVVPAGAGTLAAPTTDSWTICSITQGAGADGTARASTWTPLTRNISGGTAVTPAVVTITRIRSGYPDIAFVSSSGEYTVLPGTEDTSKLYHTASLEVSGSEVSPTFRVYSAGRYGTWIPATGKGSGKWVRQNVSQIDVSFFGAVSDKTTDNTKALNAACVAARTFRLGLLFSGPGAVNGTYYPTKGYLVSNLIDARQIYQLKMDAPIVVNANTFDSTNIVLHVGGDTNDCNPYNLENIWIAGSTQLAGTDITNVAGLYVNQMMYSQVSVRHISRVGAGIRFEKTHLGDIIVANTWRIGNILWCGNDLHVTGRSSIPLGGGWYNEQVFIGGYWRAYEWSTGYGTANIRLDRGLGSSKFYGCIFETDCPLVLGRGQLLTFSDIRIEKKAPHKIYYSIDPTTPYTGSRGDTEYPALIINPNTLGNLSRLTWDVRENESGVVWLGEDSAEEPSHSPTRLFQFPGPVKSSANNYLMFPGLIAWDLATKTRIDGDAIIESADETKPQGLRKWQMKSPSTAMSGKMFGMRFSRSNVGKLVLRVEGYDHGLYAQNLSANTHDAEFFAPRMAQHTAGTSLYYTFTAGGGDVFIPLSWDTFIIGIGDPGVASSADSYDGSTAPTIRVVVGDAIPIDDILISRPVVRELPDKGIVPPNAEYLSYANGDVFRAGPWISTTLAAQAVGGATTLTVASTDGLCAGDSFHLESNYEYETGLRLRMGSIGKIATVVDGTTLTVTPALATGTYPIGYGFKAQRWTTTKTIVADLTALAAYSGAEDIVLVSDANTGGTFARTTGLAADGVIVVTNTAAGSVFKRQYTGPADFRWWNVDQTGSTDVSTELQAALDAASYVYVPAGTYRLDSAIDLPDKAVLVGDGPGATIFDVSNMVAGTGYAFGAIGSDSVSSYYTLADNVAVGATNIVLTASSPFSAGDVGYIVDTLDSSYIPGITAARKGQTFAVTEVDSVTNLFLTEPLRHAFEMDSTPGDRRVVKAQWKTVDLSNFAVTGGTNVNVAIELGGCYSSTVDNVEASCGYRASFVLVGRDITLNNVRVDWLPFHDWGVKTKDYAIACVANGDNITVRNSTFAGDMQLVTSGGSYNYTHYLMCHDLKLVNNHLVSTSGVSAIGVRPNAEGTQIVGNTVLNGYVDVRGAYPLVANNTITGNGQLLILQQLYSMDVTVIGNVFTSLSYTSSDSRLIYVSHGSNRRPGIVSITGNKIVLNKTSKVSGGFNVVQFRESAGTDYGLKPNVRMNLIGNTVTFNQQFLGDVVLLSYYCASASVDHTATHFLIADNTVEIPSPETLPGMFFPWQIAGETESRWTYPVGSVTIDRNTFPTASQRLPIRCVLTDITKNVWGCGTNFYGYGFTSDLYISAITKSRLVVKHNHFTGLHDAVRLGQFGGDTGSIRDIIFEGNVVECPRGLVFGATTAPIRNLVVNNNTFIRPSGDWTSAASISGCATLNARNNTVTGFPRLFYYPATPMVASMVETFGVYDNGTAPTLSYDQSGLYSADVSGGDARLHVKVEDGRTGPLDFGWRSPVTAKRTSLAATTKIVDESGDAIGNFDTGWTVGASWTTNSSAVVNATGVTNSLSHTSITALVGPPRFVTMTLVSGGAWTIDADASLTVTIGGNLMRTFTNGDAPSGTMTISGMVDGSTDEVVFTVYAPDAKTVSGSFDNFSIVVLAAGDFLHRHTYPAAALVKAKSATAPAPYFEFSAAGTHATNGNAKDKVIALVNTTVTSAPAILATIPSTDNNGSWRLKGKVYAAYGVGASDYDNFMLELDYVDGSGTYVTSLHSTDLTGDVFAWNAAGYFLIGANADTADGDVTINTSSVEYKP